jgi:hypothetical protein
VTPFCIWFRSVRLTHASLAIIVQTRVDLAQTIRYGRTSQLVERNFTVYESGDWVHAIHVPASLRPKNSDAPRCGQYLPRRPTCPLISRNAIRFSERIRSRTGGPSGFGTSRDNKTGSQKRRNSSPIAAPGPVRQSSSFSFVGFTAALGAS